MKIVVGVSGASGSIYALRFLQKLAGIPSTEVHLIVSRSGEKALFLETGKKVSELKQLAHCAYPVEDVSCRLASGSFRTDGMVILPCSMNTMSAIACGVASNLMVRAADVTLKERRKLILVVRESPFHLGHLRSMVSLTEMGAIIAPPIPGFYNQPRSIDDVIDHSVERVMDLLGVPDPNAKRWDGPTI